MINRAEAKAGVALVALSVCGYVKRIVLGVRSGNIGIADAIGREGMTGYAQVRIGLRIKQVAVLATRRFGCISWDLMTPQTVAEVATGSCIVVVIRHGMRHNAGTTGVAETCLTGSVAKLKAETARCSRQRSSTPLRHVMADHAGHGYVARGTMRVGSVPLPVGRMRLGKNVTTGAGNGFGSVCQCHSIEGGCPLGAVTGLANRQIFLGLPTVDRRRNCS